MTSDKPECVQFCTDWNCDATDFMWCLAKPENLVSLSEALGMDLENSGTQQCVGAFRADML